jgi:membrane protein
VSATTLSVFAGLGMMLSFMEGFRRAYRLPRDAWSFWGRRFRALLLVAIALVPLSLATLVVVFGHQIEAWMIDNSDHELRHIVLVFWRIVRWSLALVTSAAVLAVLYHFGTRRKEHWQLVLPGAITATLLWFPATLAFGWYVTRIADYSMFYGSFGAGIATLVWLYITAFSVLIGAEMNGALYREREAIYRRRSIDHRLPVSDHPHRPSHPARRILKKPGCGPSLLRQAVTSGGPWLAHPGSPRTGLRPWGGSTLRVQ